MTDYVGATPGLSPRASWLTESMDRSAKQLAADGAERVQRAHPTLDVQADTTVGSAALALVEASQDADLLVVGTSGHRHLAGILLGSVSFAVTAHAASPVVVVRGDSTTLPGPSHPVMVGADSSAGSAAAIRYAADVAASASAPLLVLTAYSLMNGPFVQSVAFTRENSGTIPVEDIAREAAQQVSDRAVQAAREQHPGLDVTGRVVAGSPLDALVRSAGTQRCGLLVLGSRGTGSLAELALGSISHGAIHASTCPLVVVHDRARRTATAGRRPTSAGNQVTTSSPA